MDMTFKQILAIVSTCIALMPCASFASHQSALSPAELAKRQARSVHLFYTGPYKTGVTAAATTVTVRQSTPGSYFAALVWEGGYCGIQDLVKGERVVIFSVWDPVSPQDLGAKADSVREEDRAKIVYADPAMTVSRFGGEGSGAKTMAGFNWKEDKPVRFKVESEDDGENRTIFTCYIKDLSSGADWHKLASISTIRRPGVAKGLVSIYSFVEDFLRNGESAQKVRRAEFSDVEICCDGQWEPVQSGWFSADNTPSTNIEAGKIAGTTAFYLATGGDTANGTEYLWKWIN